MTIKQKVLVFSLITVLVPFSILGYFAYSHSVRTNQSRFVQELQSIAALVSGETGRRLERIAADLEAFSATPLLRQGNSREQAVALKIDAYFSSLRDRFPEYRLFRLRHGGESTAEDSLSAIGNALAELVLEEGTPCLRYKLEFRNADGGIRYLEAEAGLQILEMLLKGRANKGLYLVLGETRLMSDSGVLVPPLPVSQGNKTPVPGFSNAMFYTDPQGIERLGLSVSTAVDGLRVLAEIDARHMFTELGDLRVRVLWVLLVVLIVLLVVAHLFSRSLVRPIYSLIEGARRVAEGDLNVDSPSQRRDEIGYLSRVFDEMVGRLQESRRAVTFAQIQLQEQNQRLEAMSVTDSLTGLANRRSLNEKLESHLDQFQRNERLFSVLMLDLDHFKLINDRHGHPVGDQVLRLFAACLLRSIRSVDFAARYGGEEFTAILFETGRSDAMESAERIRREVECLRVEAVPAADITVSIGVAEVCLDDAGADTLLQRADAALYQAKQAGRNCVCFAAASLGESRLSLGRG